MEYESQEDLGVEIARLKAQIRDLKADAAVERAQAEAKRKKGCFWLGFAVPILGGLTVSLMSILFSSAPAVGGALGYLGLFAVLFAFFGKAVKIDGLSGYWRAVIGFVVGCGVLFIYNVIGSIR